MPHPNNKQDKNANPHISRLTQSCPSDEKKNKKKQKKLTSSHQNASTSHALQEAYTNHWTNLPRAETKRKKELNLEDWENETSNTIT